MITRLAPLATILDGSRLIDGPLRSAADASKNHLSARFTKSFRAISHTPAPTPARADGPHLTLRGAPRADRPAPGNHYRGN